MSAVQEYFVYENWTLKRGRVHRAQCAQCNHGKGKHETDSGRNGKWHGPYRDRALAFKKAESLRHPDMKACGFCKP